MSANHDVVRRHCDEALLKHGDTYKGALWPSDEGRTTRFDVMLDVMTARPTKPTVLCDFACGTAALLSRIKERNIQHVEYVGVDRSPLALDFARKKFPDARFHQVDTADAQCDLSGIACDYLCINGLFTAKFEVSHDAMWHFFESTIRRLWPCVRHGLAVNVMSTIVDWERDDLFHVPMDQSARLLHSLVGRHVMIRADYGAYEYTIYGFKQNPRINLLGA